ncbi:endonuclease/exonuclease/phosphatase family protein [Flavobacterium sp. FlaQc-47]|uniref:endonuclease/exonuclease/phosphatase family protein n=1 Tax=Flavobacterium sp. FlaQc-47 TaxID=3374180 RepID=UPI003757741C
MKNILRFVLLFYTTFTFSQTKILSWNLENFGKSKSQSEINFIANTILNYDIVALQEVVAGYGGAQAVAKLAAALNQKGAKWDYSISDPTSSSSYKTERYAFIWKTSRVKLKGNAWLEKKYHLEIDREPYFGTFEINNKTITLVNFHAITKSKQPETEIKYFKFLPLEYPALNLVFLGDFNCPQSHTVFNPLKKMRFAPILQNQKTTLKQQCKNNICLASEFDNIFYKATSLTYIHSGIIPFYENFNSLKEARKISDHIPIWFEFSIN